MLNFRRLPRIAAALAALCTVCAPAGAQTYPAKPVRFIIPFPPGGPTDILGRIVAAQLSETWSVQVIPDNRPGAGGNVGTEQCARAPADGYTACMLSIAQTISPAIYPKLDILVGPVDQRGSLAGLDDLVRRQSVVVQAENRPL